MPWKNWVAACRSTPGPTQVRRISAATWPLMRSRGAVRAPSRWRTARGRAMAPGGAWCFRFRRHSDTGGGARWAEAERAPAVPPQRAVRAPCGLRHSHAPAGSPACGCARVVARLGPWRRAGELGRALQCVRCGVERAGRTAVRLLLATPYGAGPVFDPSGHAPARIPAGWQCARCGLALPSRQPGRHRCVVPVVRMGGARDRLAEQALRAVLARAA